MVLLQKLSDLLDDPILSPFITIPQQDHDRPMLHKIHPIAGTVIDPHFHQSTAEASHISRISQFQTANASIYPCFSSLIP
jgi:hypothetical protein